MRSGLTPVVAVAILMGMAVVAAGGAYSWVQMVQQEGLDEASRNIDTELTVKDITCADATVELAVKNSGGRDITAQTATFYLYQEGDLLDTVQKDVAGEGMLDAGGLSQFGVPFTTYLVPGTGYQVEMEFAGADYMLERGCTGETGDMVGYWNFDSIASRTISDLTVNENDGTFHGAVQNGTVNGLLHNGTRGGTTASESSDPTWSTDCVSGNCLTFDGNDDYVSVADHGDLDLSSAFTLTAWVWPDGYGNNGVIVRKDNAYSFYFANELDFYNWADSSRLTCDRSNIPLDEWTHVAAVWNGTHKNIYTDGTLCASATSVDFQTNNNDVAIGANSGNSGYNFPGRLDDIRIYDRALDRQELVAVRDGTAPGSGIVAYYPFDEGSGQDVWNGAFQVPGRHGQAMRFDGTDDYIGVDGAPDVSSTGEQDSFTISFWMNHSTGTGAIVEWGNSGGSQGAHVWAHNSQDDLWLNPNGDCSGGWEATGAIVHDEWHHYTALYDAQDDEFRWYRDGELVKTVSDACSPDTVADGIRMGNRGGDDRFIDAELDDVRIYDRALSMSEIQDDISGEPPVQGIAARYDFDGPAGRTVWNSGFWQQGLNGGSIHLTRPEQRVEAPPTLGAIGGGSFTVSLWADERNGTTTSRMPVLFRISDADNDPRLTIQRDRRYSNDNDYLMWQLAEPDGTGVTLRYGEWLGSGTPLRWEDETGWHHIVGVRDAQAGQMRLYIDGTLQDSAPDTNISSSLDLGQNDTYLGNQIMENQAFDGLLDDIRIYGKALSTEEVSALYNATN